MGFQDNIRGIIGLVGGEDNLQGKISYQAIGEVVYFVRVGVKVVQFLDRFCTEKYCRRAGLPSLKFSSTPTRTIEPYNNEERFSAILNRTQ